MTARWPDQRPYAEVFAQYAVPAADVAERLAAREPEVAAFTELQPPSSNDTRLLPLAVKSLISAAGLTAPVGSPAHPGRYHEDAPSVQALSAAGFSVIGQTSSPQLGMGVRTEGSRNPWDSKRIVGGSSGGSAAAVAAGMVDVALGTDTGGSIRIPAALCGVVGFRPSAGSVNRDGVVRFSSTFDQVGPLTSTVALARATTQVLWAADGGTAPAAAPELAWAEKRVLGVPWSYVRAHTSAAVLREFERAAGVLEGLGFHLTEVDLEPNEVWADLQRVVRVPEAWHAHQRLLTDPRIELSPVARATLQSGPTISEAVYAATLARRSDLIDHWNGVFHDIPAVITPTTPVVAPQTDCDLVEVATGTEGSVDEVLGRFTRPWSTLGVPSISVPTGQLVDGLPVGLQIASAEGRDHLVLDLAELFEQHSPLARRPPVLDHSAR